MKAQGKTPKDDSWKLKYKEPIAPDTSDLPELPDGWCWANTQQLGEVQLGRQRSPKNRSKHYPTKYIRAANITEKGLDFSNILDMEFEPHERERYLLKDGDIILSEASGSPSQVGKPAIWREQLPECCFQNTVIRLRALNLSNEYLLIVFKSFYFNNIFSKIAAGVGINHLSANKFSLICVSLPPLKEQIQIFEEVERHLSVIEQLEKTIDSDIKRAEKLRQSILKQAFEGKLVPQDPNDEPAEKLLERIKAEKAKQTTTKTKRKTQSKKQSDLQLEIPLK
jgi:type I restriction enzyme S subunit